MAELGELCLWAALPLGALAVWAAVAGAWSARGDLAEVGGRAAAATAGLLLFSLAGLAHALVTVRLKYAYVADWSGFQEPWGWRLAALWSVPQGGLLVLGFLMMAAAALTGGGTPSRQASARAGVLAALSLAVLASVVVRAQPFMVSEAPALAGAGLPSMSKDGLWQIEIAATYLAVPCAGLALAGVLSAELLGGRDDVRAERGAVSAASGLLTIALTASMWRAYGDSGRLLDATGTALVAVHVPAWLLTLAYLHAPGGAATPAWAARWRRVLGLATFAAVLGDGAAILAGGGAVPPPELWAGGLAVGMVAGGVASLAPVQRGVEELLAVPGYGHWAFGGGFFSLAVAGLAAVWGLVRGPILAGLTWPAALLGLGLLAVWPVLRPAGRWRRVWAVALPAGLAAALFAALFGDGWVSRWVLAAGLCGALAVGSAADLVRMRAAHRRSAVAPAFAASAIARTVRARTRRRGAALLGHLGLAFLLLGLAAEALTTIETQPLGPGETLSLEAGSSESLRLTYLGLSRYQREAKDRQVASFSLYGSGRPPRLVTASITYDARARRGFRTPGLVRGFTRDVIVDIAGRTSGEGVVVRLASRPLSNLVWLGGALLFATVVVRGRESG